MHRGLFALFLLAAPNMVNAASTTPGTIMDVAPTTLDLAPGAAGLLFVTNHGARAVTVQIEAMDWHQDQNRDVLSPSTNFFASPPMVRIEAGARQTVRVMAPKSSSAGENAYRLLVSELPDPNQDSDGVHVLLQFSVPVFVRHDPHLAPQIAWTAQNGRLLAVNQGVQAVKLAGLTLDGAASPQNALVYLLPGAAHDFGAIAQSVQIQARDGRSGAGIAAHVAP
jgi:fimbrial chaperone protein